MNRFLFKLLLFGCVLFFYLVFIGFTNYLIYTSADLKLKPSNMLIIGDSHPQTSLDTSYFFDCQNISQSAEPYILTYWKLKKVLQLWRPDTIILGFSPHNISAFNDLKFSKKKWADEIFKRSYTIHEFHTIRNKIEVDFNRFYKILFQQTFIFPKINHFHFIGTYKAHKNSDISDFEASIKRHYFFQDKELGISDISISYLDSIVFLCKASDIVPVLISNPIHKSYYEKIPTDILYKFHKLESEFTSKEVIVLNRSQDHYFDQEFLNSDHLNYKGAARFSKYIKSILTRE